MSRTAHREIENDLRSSLPRCRRKSRSCRRATTKLQRRVYKREVLLDVKYTLKIYYSVESVGESLRALMSRIINYRLPKERKLTFYISSINVEPPDKIYWKVRNTGQRPLEEKCREVTLGWIAARQITETSNFDGDHFFRVLCGKERRLCCERTRRCSNLTAAVNLH